MKSLLTQLEDKGEYFLFFYKFPEIDKIIFVLAKTREEAARKINTVCDCRAVTNMSKFLFMAQDEALIISDKNKIIIRDLKSTKQITL